MAAKRVGAMFLADRCSLLDFGTLQLLWDRVAGEYRKVFGRDACAEHGPWQLQQEDGKHVLVSFADDSGKEWVLEPEYLLKVQVRQFEEEGINKVEVVHLSAEAETLAAPEPLSEWCDNQRSLALRSTVLRIDVPGNAPFVNEYYWEHLPRTCGDKPVMLWMNLKWLLEYLRGKDKVDRTAKSAQEFRLQMQKVGLDPSHIRYPARSQEDLADKGLEAGRSPEPCCFRISMVGTFVLLESFAHNAKFHSNPGEQLSDKAGALIDALLRWPMKMHGEDTIVLGLPGAECQLLIHDGEVDWASLRESEEALCKEGSFRTTRNACRFPNIQTCTSRDSCRLLSQELLRHTGRCGMPILSLITSSCHVFPSGLEHCRSSHCT